MTVNITLFCSLLFSVHFAHKADADWDVRQQALLEFYQQYIHTSFFSSKCFQIFFPEIMHYIAVFFFIVV